MTTFHVNDPARGRELMVLVYPDSANAEFVHSNVQAHEVDAGVRLVPGYGLSTWCGNVAMVESTTRDLTRQYAAQLDRDNQVGPSGLETVDPAQAQPSYAVELDFLAVIDGGIVNL
ncbi:MAG TPA: hypothetical protein VGQ62_04160 [Chloroflexota bacterium]|nr:hypothetical protein [Chloroflexota bacterium]